MTARKKYTQAVTPMPQWPGMEKPEGKSGAEKRIKAEGKKRHMAFTLRREELRTRLLKTGEWTRDAARDESWAKATIEYPPIPVEEWEDEKGETGPIWTCPPLDVDEELSRLPTTTEKNIIDAFLWVADHRALSRKSPAGSLYLVNQDIQGCPTRFAWNLLHQAIENPDGFRKEMMQRIKPPKPVGEEDVGPTESDEDLDAILGRAMG